jgi:hypothetical protein
MAAAYLLRLFICQSPLSELVILEPFALLKAGSVKDLLIADSSFHSE